MIWKLSMKHRPKRVLTCSSGHEIGYNRNHWMHLHMHSDGPLWGGNSHRATKNGSCTHFHHCHPKTMRPSLTTSGGTPMQPHIWGLWCQKQVSHAGISNCLSQYCMGCNYLSLPEIPASGTKVFICKCRCYNSASPSLALVHLFDIEGILPRGPYLPCVSMVGRALLARYPRYQLC